MALVFDIETVGEDWNTLDETTQQRIARPSAEIYRQIIADNGIRREMLEQWEKAPA